MQQTAKTGNKCLFHQNGKEPEARVDRDTRESYIIAKRSQRCTPRTGRDARETHRSRCIAKDIYIYILKRKSHEKRGTQLRDRSMEKSRLLFFEEFERRTRTFSRKETISSSKIHFRPILFRFSNNLHPIGWPSALEIVYRW